jgi:hypothetical protein
MPTCSARITLRFCYLSSLHLFVSSSADSGRGSAYSSKSLPPVAGTVEVTIGGQSSPASTSSAPTAARTTMQASGIYTDSHAVGYSASAPSNPRGDSDWTMSHPIWAGEYIGRVKYTHLPPVTLADKLAAFTIKMIRFNFDWMSGYSFGKITRRKALNRIVFLEAVAGVPGSVAAIVRHLASLRRMKRDGGWINTLMAEAENERMVSNTCTCCGAHLEGKAIRMRDLDAVHMISK